MARTEGLHARPGREWARQFLHGMRLSCENTAKCVDELHSLQQQDANARRLFVKCWLTAARQYKRGHGTHSRGALDMLVQIVHAGKTDAVLPARPWPRRSCSSRSPWTM